MVDQGLGWSVAGAAVVDQGAEGVGDQSPPGAGAVGGDQPGEACGDRSVAGQVAGLVVGAEQGGQGDGDLDLRPPPLPPLPGGGAGMAVGGRLVSRSSRGVPDSTAANTATNASARRWSALRSSATPSAQAATASGCTSTISVSLIRTILCQEVTECNPNERRM